MAMDKKELIKLKKSVCTTCLSRNRNLFLANEIGQLKKVFPDLKFGKNDKICWECKAMVKKIMAFKSRIYKAQVLFLEITNRGGLDQVKSLSNLTILDTDILSYGNSNTTEVKLETIKEEIPVNIEIGLDLHYNTDNIEEGVTLFKEPKVEPEPPTVVIDSDDIDMCPVLKVNKESQTRIEDYMQLDEEITELCMEDGTPSKTKTETKIINLKDFDSKTGKLYSEFLKEITVTKSELEELRLKKAGSQRSAFKCLDCLEAFRDDDALEEHNLKHSAKSGNFSCKICKQRMLTKKELVEHTKLHFRCYECLSCAYRSIDFEVVLNHYHRNHHTRTIGCYSCTETFQTAKQLKLHRRNVHRAAKDCPICGKTFKDPSNIKRHMRLHKDLPVLECSKCHKKLRSESGLKLHMLSHDDKEKPLSECPICHKKYTSESGLKAHLKTHDEKVDTEAFCYTCGIQFKSMTIYRMHLKNSLKHVAPEDMKFQCPHCEKRFIKQARLTEHMLVHTDDTNFGCELCSQAFKTAKLLRRHVGEKHEGKERERRHVCEICPKAFYNKVTLEQHLNSHLGRRPYVCELCAATFTFESALYTHKKLKHGKKPGKKPTKVKN